MYLNGTFLGVTPLVGAISIIPPVVQYDVFKFYGSNTGAKFTQTWGRNIKLTADLVDSYTLETFAPSWNDRTTYFLSRFKNSLNGGNIDEIVGEVVGWNLYRKEGTSDTLEFLGTQETLNIVYRDWTALTGKTYQYYLFAKDLSHLSSPISTNEMTSDYYGWFLIDIENDRAFQFDINFEGGEMSYEDDITEFVTNNRVNAFTKGKHFAINGTISAIVSVDNSKKDITNTNNDLQLLSEFIQSDRPKLLKSRKGEIWKVFTSDYGENLLNSALTENIYISSFNFKEAGDD